MSTTAAATAARQAEIRHRLDELEWLLDGGVWPPTACARVGWSVDAARQAAARRGLPAAAQRRAA